MAEATPTPGTQAAGVPNKFATPPRVAQQFYDRFQHSEAGQSLQQPPVVESQHVAQPGVHNQQPVRQDPLDKPYTEPQSQPVQMPQPAPQQPVMSPQPYYDPAMVNQLAYERDALRQQLAKVRAEQQAYAEQQASQQLVDQLYNDPELQNLESVDPEDARKIAGAVSNVVGSHIRQLRNDLAQQRAEAQQGFYEMQQRELLQKDQRTAAAILKEHPDFFNLYRNSKEFQQFLRGHDGYSSRSREDVATDEFYAGNTAYVIDLLNRFKSGQPNSQHTMSVAPVQVAQNAVQSAPTQPAPSYSLGELNSLMQTRQITPDEYRQLLKEWRAANSR